MTQNQPSGLGELLRRLCDLLDRGSEAHYISTGLVMRARYTPILRALGEGTMTVTELQKQLRLTQGAISQTVKLMERDGLILRTSASDKRSQKIKLTPKGASLREELVHQWALRLAAIGELEEEIGVSLREHLEQAIEKLEQKSFDKRLHHLKNQSEAKV